MIAHAKPHAPLDVYATTVASEWVDYNGHMNDAAYAIVFSRSVDALMDRIGLDAAARKRTGQTLFTLQMMLHYFKEAKEGDALAVTCHLLEHDDKRMRVWLDMTDAGRRAPRRVRAVAPVGRAVAEAAPRAAPWSFETQAALDALAASHASMAHPPRGGRGRRDEAEIARIGCRDRARGLMRRALRRPWRQHDLAAESAGVDARMNFASRLERQAVDDDGMDGAVPQQLEQRRHVGLELVGVGQPARGDAVPDGPTAVEQAAERAPDLEPQEAEARRREAFATDRHRLRPVADQQAARRQAGERAGEMGAADGVERGVDAGAALARRGETAHRGDEIARAIVDGRRAVALDDRHVGGRAGADRLQAEMAREIEQRRADCPRRSDHQNRRRRAADGGSGSASGTP